MDKFLEFKDETVTQILIQFVKLFPLVRMRVANQRVADRLELQLKSLISKYGKM